MRRAAAAALIVAALMAGACAEPAIPTDVAARLEGRVADIRSAIEAGQTYAARQQLGKLTTLVGRLLDDGTLEEGTATEILGAADEVESLLDLAPDRSASATETTPPPSPTAEPGEDQGNEGEGNGDKPGKDKGKGHGDEGHGNDD